MSARSRRGSVHPLSPSPDNERVVRAIYDASARADIPGILELHHPRAVWEMPGPGPFGGVLLAHGPLGEYLAALYAQLGGGLRTEIEELAASRDRVLVQGHFVHRGTRVRLADMWQMRDGLAIKRLLAFDTATAFAVMSGIAAP